jgi:hypothetical protein
MTTLTVRWVPGAASDAVASARLRCYRPSVALAKAGWDSVVATGRRPMRADVVVFQKAYSDRHLALAARLRRRGTAIVLDLCDNHLHYSATEPVLARRADRLRRMIGLADVITASTPSMAELVDHPCVKLVDDALEMSQPIRLPTAERGRRLVWFGNAGSDEEGFGMCDLGAIMSDVEKLAAGIDCELVVLSSSRDAFERHVGPRRIAARYVNWTPAAAAEALASADVALLPITPNPFTRCKTSNRVATALQSGVAVVAGRIPSYEEFSPYVRFGDWTNNLAAYLLDGNLRLEDVTRGQEFVSRRFPPELVGEQWTTALSAALSLR